LHNYEHKKLIETITMLDQIPAEVNTYSDWIRAKKHLAFLHANAQSSELVIYASGEFSFVHSVIVPNDDLFPLDREDLMNWSMNPYTSIASYVMGGGRKDIWVERGLSGSGTKTLKNSMQLIFGRTFEGWTGSGRNYYEVHQEYAHLSEIHWRPEKRAYCRFDENGDIEAVVSITTREDSGNWFSKKHFK
jgi:hypothetical protein